MDTSPRSIPQVCVIPFRRKGDRIEVCLITSLSNRNWIFPKGIVEPEQSCDEAALNEAMEEAGLHGHIVGDAIGKYEDTKWGARLRVTVLMMEVTDCDDDWLEAEVRERRWVGPEKASDLLSKPILRELLDIAVQRVLKKQNL